MFQRKITPMASAASRLALVPLVAVTIVLGVSGIHGRHTHDPARAERALDLLLLTQDERVAKAELDAFFETGFVGWDVKTAVEIECGTTRARAVAEPVLCVTKSRTIVFNHLCNEQQTYRTYTMLAWSALAPGLLVIMLGVLQLAAARKARRSDRTA